MQFGHQEVLFAGRAGWLPVAGAWRGRSHAELSAAWRVPRSAPSMSPCALQYEPVTRKVNNLPHKLLNLYYLNFSRPQFFYQNDYIAF